MTESALALVWEWGRHPQELDIARLPAIQRALPPLGIQLPTAFRRQPQGRGGLASVLGLTLHWLVPDTARSLVLEMANLQAVEPHGRRGLKEGG